MSSLLLPEAARLIHIGPQKTGTTAIQVAMFEARDSMAEHGAYYPKDAYRRRGAGWELGLPDGKPIGQDLRRWNRLVREVRSAGDARACVSNEDFARATPPQIERIVSDLGGEAAHVVAVARRLDKYLPSQWQEQVKAGVTRSFDNWLRLVLTEEDNGSYARWNVWMGHDVEALVHRWLDVVPPDRFTLLVADESDHSLLPRTFESMLGLPAGLLRANPRRSNRGLSWAEAELVRSLRKALRGTAWPREEFQRLLVDELKLHEAPTVGPRSAWIPDWAHERIRELSDARIAAVQRLPVRVVGDPERLRVGRRAEGQEPPVAGELSLPVSTTVRLIEGIVQSSLPRAAGTGRPSS
ncbi:MAG TPA: hypothetical protein VFK52_11695 [Nocardioidaceae bacterium]|nr:hypothetical protein [Nocardioidaceae bacterium]